MSQSQRCWMLRSPSSKHTLWLCLRLCTLDYLNILLWAVSLTERAFSWDGCRIQGTHFLKNCQCMFLFHSNQKLILGNKKGHISQNLKPLLLGHSYLYHAERTRPSPAGNWLSSEHTEGGVGLGQSWCFRNITTSTAALLIPGLQTQQNRFPVSVHGLQFLQQLEVSQNQPWNATHVRCP